MESEIDAPVVIETYVQAKQGFADGYASLYTQGEDGAFFIYSAQISEEDYDKLTEGQKIRVTGYKGEWAGEIEIVDGVVEVLEGEDTFVAEPEDVTEFLGKDDELINFLNQEVSFKGLTVAASDNDGEETAFLYNWDGSGSKGDDLYFNVTADGETYTFTVESSLCDENSDVYKAVEELQIGDVIDAEGFLYWYEGANPHITSVTVVEAAAAESEAAESETAESEAVESEAAESEAVESEAAESEAESTADKK
jgi:hypothetical protein